MQLTLNGNKQIIFLGDNHGCWGDLFAILEKNKITNSILVSVGDCGIGFTKHSQEIQNIERLNSFFRELDIEFKAIRGNHDDPSYFTREKRIALSNFELIEDYSVYQYQDKTIQFIGGAISIDRTGRVINKSYWKDEAVNYKPSKCQKVDVLITHTAPSFCFPHSFNEIVYGWAAEDYSLIQDLTNERKVMDKIFEICDPSFHAYGHFHSSWTEKINNCSHTLLAINELKPFLT